MEQKSATFLASVDEDPETCRPEYDYAATREELKDLQAQARKLRHALNVFNSTHTVPGFDMTIDEMLVYIPQLTKEKEKLDRMKSALPKSRVDNRFGTQNFIDYEYVNYDIKAVAADFEAVSKHQDRDMRLQILVIFVCLARLFFFLPCRLAPKKGHSLRYNERRKNQRNPHENHGTINEEVDQWVTIRGYQWSKWKIRMI